MDQAITIGGLLTVVAVIGGLAILLGICFAVLSAWGKGMSR